MKMFIAIALLLSIAGLAGTDEASREVERLADEVRGKGWIVFPTRSEQGDWDLFLMRPDGSQRRSFTRTPEWNEAAPQFSRDGSRLLYRRLKRAVTIEGNRYGEQGALVVAKSDGTDVRILGGEGDWAWASWSPDGREIATLSIKGVAFVDLASGQVRRTLPRQGFFQQLTWSPDGRWLCGVANSFGAGWSVARLNAVAGEANPVSKVDCCTPDWFPDNGKIIFSNRPPGQKANHGQGWTQLWMAGADGQNAQLVYGEDGRHIYGGHVSPDGRYTLFTGNPQEDGDPQHAGAPMSLVRLSDTPIIGGESSELRARHPGAKSGPVLTLPAGWEPCWTFSENPAFAAEPDTVALSRELSNQGWIVCSAAGHAGDWDLFAMRPNGAGRRQLTDTREFNETGARFSPDGKRLLYYRQPAAEAVDNNTYGAFELVLADANGANPVKYGRNFPWASWGPDSKSLAALTPGGIQIVEVATRKILRTLPRKGLVQQLVWSPDGRSFTGTANGLGQFWNIGILDAMNGQIRAASETERYNCTPDWMPDSHHIVYARGIVPNLSGRAELWMAALDRSEKRMLYAEAGRHIYGGAVSPDGRYLLFTRSEEDLGKVDHGRTSMAIIRMADTPMVGDEDKSLRKRFPAAKQALRLDLGPGWEPHWTAGDIPVNSTQGVTP